MHHAQRAFGEGAARVARFFLFVVGVDVVVDAGQERHVFPRQFDRVVTVAVGNELRREDAAVVERVVQCFEADFRAAVVVHQDVAHNHGEGAAEGDVHLSGRDVEEGEGEDFVAHAEVVGHHQVALDAEVFVPEEDGREDADGGAALAQVERGADVVPFEEVVGQDGSLAGFRHVEPPAAEIGIPFAVQRGVEVVCPGGGCFFPSVCRCRLRRFFCCLLPLQCFFEDGVVVDGLEEVADFPRQAAPCS